MKNQINQGKKKKSGIDHLKSVTYEIGFSSATRLFCILYVRGPIVCATKEDRTWRTGHEKIFTGFPIL